MTIFIYNAQTIRNKKGLFDAIFILLAAIIILAAFPAQLLADNSLTKVSLTKASGYNRLSFTFKEAVEAYDFKRDDVDKVTVTFSSSRLGRPPDLPTDDFIRNIELSPIKGIMGKNEIAAKIELASPRYEMRHFISHDRLTVGIDFKNLESEDLWQMQQQDETSSLALPSLGEIASSMLENLAVKTFEDEAEINLYRRILGKIVIMDSQGALEDINLFFENFPKSPYTVDLRYLKAELSFFSGPPSETYAAATEMWKEAFERWPDHPLAVRGRYMDAEASSLSGQNNEAAAKFKILYEDNFDQNSIYKKLALLRAVDILFSLGLIDEGRGLLEPVLEKGEDERLSLEAFVRVGMADFYQGFFTQANEVFMECLKFNPKLYLTYPEMLYAAGEAYHYLKQAELSRLFLFHAINLMPEHPKADVILARIGDDYRREGRDREAMAIYGAAKQNFPNGDGGLISQVRLAEMGALHSFFTQERVFDALEKGSRQATVEMYKKIVDSGSDSPLMQLAQFKIGSALAEDGENYEAIKWLRDIEMNNPRSPLLAEVLPELGRAIVQEITLKEELAAWKDISDLWADNSSYINENDKLSVMRSVARAYENLGRFADARDMWKEMNPEEAIERLYRYVNLVELSLKQGRPGDAHGFLKEMQNEFPEESKWIEAKTNEVGRALAKGGNVEAADALLRFASSTSYEPARKNALSAAIDIDINLGRYENALKLIQSFRSSYPADALSKEYLLTQAEISRSAKNIEKAWDYLDEFRKLYPSDPRGLSSLKNQVDEAEEVKKFDAALKFMDMYSQVGPDKAQNRLMQLRKMRKEWELERYRESAASFENFLKLYPNDPETPEIMHQRALDDWDRGRYDEARRTWDDLRKLFPTHPFIAKTYSDQYRRAVSASFTAEAVNILDDFRRLMPNDPAQSGLMLEEAKDLLAAGKAVEAHKAWARFRENYPNDPRNPDLLLIQARQEMKDGQAEAALSYYQEILDKYPNNPRNPDIYLELAAAETKLQRFQQARDHLSQFNYLYRDHPSRPKALLDQAELNLSLGLNDEAIIIYPYFREQYPDAAENPATYLAQGRLEVQVARPGDAIKTLEEGLTNYPGLANDQNVQNLLTQLYLDEGHVEKWAAIVERNLRANSSALNQNDKFFKFNQLAQVYQKLGMAEDAERNLDSAMANKPPDLTPESLYAIAKAYKEMSLNAKYIDVLKILAASQDDMWRSVAEKELAEIAS